MISRMWPILIGAIFGVIGIVAGLFEGGGDMIEGLHLAAAYTARAGFPLLMLAYSATSLARLWPNSATRGLLRNRRILGLGFALTHALHVITIIAYVRAQGKPIPLAGAQLYPTLVFLMAITSNNASQRLLGRYWKWLHTFGIHALWLGYAGAYLGAAYHGENRLLTVPFGLITVAALGLRIAAWGKRRAVLTS